ncbi:MAG: biotin--[acetyl-CoA-carboxylase] ligase [Asgard group archaeon]|nr:biotin--[acetyl-CoA-carboxylase] ligase [Asgard group archaeon]
MGTLKWHLENYEALPSTQLKAQELVNAQQITQFTVIKAKKQTAGIGRKNRSWVSPLGGLWASFIIPGEVSPKNYENFPIFLGLRLVQQCEDLFNIPFTLRWPNDLMVSSKKIGGIIIDNRVSDEVIKMMIVGLGLNINLEKKQFPSMLQKEVTSIFLETQRIYSLDALTEILAETIYQTFKEARSGRTADIVSLWKEKSYSYKKEIQVITNGKKLTGIEKGITPQGHLQFQTNEENLKTIIIEDLDSLRIVKKDE